MEVLMLLQPDTDTLTYIYRHMSDTALLKEVAAPTGRYSDTWRVTAAVALARTQVPTTTVMIR